MLQQPRPDPATLKLVSDDERRLGQRGVAQADVVSERDDALLAVVREGSHERAAFVPVGVEDRLDELLVHAPHAVEAQVAAPVGKPGEERRSASASAAVGGLRR